MNINSTAYVLLISLLTESAYCKPPESLRFERGALHQYADDKSDPNFWPVRGRRGADPLRRGGRKSKHEETGVFWAGRGRSSEDGLLDEEGFWAHRGRDVPDDNGFWAHRGRDLSDDNGFWAHRGRDLGNFWAHRGRDLPDDNGFWAHRGRDLVEGRLTVDEPGWTWKERRRSDETGDDGGGLAVPCSGGNRNEKREILREKLCELKRKSSSQFLREVPAGAADQFWPLRGRKRSGELATGRGRGEEEGALWEGAGKRAEEETWPEGLRDLKTFWPTRGKRYADMKKVNEEPNL